MVNCKQLSFLFFISIVFSCGKPLPELRGFDSKAWKDDKNACANKRAQLIDAIQSQKEKLLALDEMGIIKLLGKPDQNELYKRNQKFYSYNIHPAKECNQETISEPLKLVIRFNAMGLAKEVSVE